MTKVLQQAPTLSTPDYSFIQEGDAVKEITQEPRLRQDELYIIYEIERTLREIRKGRWRRIALQFPDEMLVDAPRVVRALDHGLQEDAIRQTTWSTAEDLNGIGTVGDRLQELDVGSQPTDFKESSERRLYILGDTSYGACCVDEIAAEHIDADVVVHYGRSCLSPTSRLPVIHVFTQQVLSLDAAEQAFKGHFPDPALKIVLASDVMYTKGLGRLYERLVQSGHVNIFLTSIIEDPSSPIPNRTVPIDVQSDPSVLSGYHLFHVSQPPASLLLMLASRMASIHIFSTQLTTTSTPSSTISPSSAPIALRRRYALVLSVANASIFGILINTLSVKNYMHIVKQVKRKLELAGRKSYTFVVGKVNAAKLANFSEVDGWVVIGCWESSLIDSKDFYKPIITPFELDLALQPNETRVFTGRWTSSFDELLRGDHQSKPAENVVIDDHHPLPERKDKDGEEEEEEGGERGADDGQDGHISNRSHLDSEPESDPPEFDLRTGQLVSRPRYNLPSPPHPSVPAMSSAASSHVSSQTLVHKPAVHNSGDDGGRGGGGSQLTTIGGQISLGASFLLSNRTWRGLGSDLTIEYDDDESRPDQQGGGGALIEQGRSGIARGYAVTHDNDNRIVDLENRR